MAKCKICGWDNMTLPSEIKGICTPCLDKPFVVTTVCRADLLMEEGMFKKKDVAKFDDAMMQDLADKIGESTTGEAGTFWLVLDEYGHELLEGI